jgi:hypothetical protein
MIFPNDAIQLNFTTPPNSGVVLLPANTTRTILYVLDTSYSTGGDAYITDDSNGFILVDATPNLRRDERLSYYITSGQIVSHNSATSGNSTGQIIYVNYDLSARPTETLIENSETGAKFWISQSFSYGDAIIITFATIFMFCIIGKVVYNFLFKNA